jgi:hypothetical protein
VLQNDRRVVFTAKEAEEPCVGEEAGTDLVVEGNPPSHVFLVCPVVVVVVGNEGLELRGRAVGLWPQAFFPEKGSKLVLRHSQIWVLDCILLEQSTQPSGVTQQDIQHEDETVPAQSVPVEVSVPKLIMMTVPDYLPTLDRDCSGSKYGQDLHGSLLRELMVAL